MSILLESLGKEADKQAADNIASESGAPADAQAITLNTRHFDDEFDQEDMLRQARNRWRLFSLVLLLILLLSWGWFFMQGTALEKTSEPTVAASSLAGAEKAAADSMAAIQPKRKSHAQSVIRSGTHSSDRSPMGRNIAEANSGSRPAPASSDPAMALAKTNATTPEKAAKKERWQPRKMVSQSADHATVAKGKTRRDSASPDQVSKSEMLRSQEGQLEGGSPHAKGNVNNPSGRIWQLSDLPHEIREALPPLTISSWVIAEPKSKSFAVLDGQIYGIGEMIAPHLKLTDIDNQQILVTFHDYLIALPTQP